MDLVRSLGSLIASSLQATASFLWIMVAIELVIPKFRYSLRSRLPGALICMVGAVAAILVVAPLQLAWEFIGLRPLLVLAFDQWFAWAGPFGVFGAQIAALMVGDLSGYWLHRIEHSLLWPFHAVHHSPRDLHATNNYKHPLSEAFHFLIVIAPMSLIPVQGGAGFAFVGFLIALHQSYIHSPVRLHFGPLRRLIVDNRFHRIHHSTNPDHFDRNFGVYFSIWDQMFGTAYFPKPDEWPETGLAEIAEPKTLGEWLDFPLRFVKLRPRPPLASL